MLLLDSLETEARSLAIDSGFDWNEALGSKAQSHGIPTQFLSIARSGLFDAPYYLQTNKDIAALGVNPLRHYVEYGDAEGRWPNACFNPKAYRAYFDEGALKGLCSLYHYAVIGEALGLGAPPDFDAQRYLATYPELAEWLDRPLTHYLNIGRHHGLALHHRIRLASGQRVLVKKKQTQVSSVKFDGIPSINIVGPLEKVSGLGVSARGYVDGLRLSGFTRLGGLCQPLAFARQSNIPADEFPVPPFIENAPINVVHMNGDTLPLMLEHGGHKLLDGAHNIGVWYWELPVLRPEWYESLSYFHEFWAPTPFIAETLRAATSKRVTLLPPYLGQFRDTPQRDGGGTGVNPYFIYCFDANSILERKNPMSLVKAFLKAFPLGGPEQHFDLVLKVTYPNRGIPEVAELYEAAAADLRIKIVDDLLSSADLNTLVANATAYVSPHRSEGLGLTVIEAMAAGVPVITTTFGGLASFIDESTAWPVEFDLLELPSEYHPYPKGFVWANPKVDSIAHQMRQVVDNSEMVRLRTATARSRVIDYFSSAPLLERYSNALKVVTAQK